jgi:hypothetical protein
MGSTGFAPTLPVLEEYNHNELYITQLAEAKARKAERDSIVRLIKDTYKKPTQQMLDLLARLEANDDGSGQDT